MFVSDDDDLCFFVGVVLNFSQPTLDTFYGLRLGQVVDEDDSDCVFVVGPCDGPEGLLPCLRLMVMIRCPRLGA